MKKIALKEKTFQILRDLKRKKEKESFDQLSIDLVIQEEKIPQSMFGSLKGKIQDFNTEDRRNMWKERI